MKAALTTTSRISGIRSVPGKPVLDLSILFMEQRRSVCGNVYKDSISSGLKVLPRPLHTDSSARIREKYTKYKAYHVQTTPHRRRHRGRPKSQRKLPDCIHKPSSYTTDNDLARRLSPQHIMDNWKFDPEPNATHHLLSWIHIRRFP